MSGSNESVQKDRDGDVNMEVENEIKTRPLTFDLSRGEEKFDIKNQENKHGTLLKTIF